MDRLDADAMRVPGAEVQALGRCTSTNSLLLERAPFFAAPFVGDRARLYLLDLPGGSARVLAIAVITDVDSFETVLESAAPIVDSIEFHAR